MPAPKKRLGKGKNRLKFEDVSPRAEADDQVHVKKYKDDELIDLSPNAEKNERKEVTGKKYGGKVKKMYHGGKACRGMGKATRGGNYGKMG
jgi:hypothetical protein